MLFVGREKKKKEILCSLRKGINVFVRGSFGMGRTTLIKHLANTQNDLRFIFVDFSKPPLYMCNTLLRELFPNRKFSRNYIKYKSGRFQLMTHDLEDKRKHVIVLDNITRLTAPKLNMVRHLNWENRFFFIGIIESFLPKEEFFRLRSWLDPSVTVILQRLNKRNGIEFFQRLSASRRFNWDERQIESLAATAGGYPLRMIEIAARELEHDKEKHTMASLNDTSRWDLVT